MDASCMFLTASRMSLKKQHITTVVTHQWLSTACYFPLSVTGSPVAATCTWTVCHSQHVTSATSLPVFKACVKVLPSDGTIWLWGEWCILHKISRYSIRCAITGPTSSHIPSHVKWPQSDSSFWTLHSFVHCIAWHSKQPVSHLISTTSSKYTSHHELSALQASNFSNRHAYPLISVGVHLQLQFSCYMELHSYSP